MTRATDYQAYLKQQVEGAQNIMVYVPGYRKPRHEPLLTVEERVFRLERQMADLRGPAPDMTPRVRVAFAILAALVVLSTAGMVLAVARMDARVVAHQTLPIEVLK